MVFTKEWFKAAAVRALKTAAQTLLTMFTVGQAFFEVNWLNALSVAGVSAIYSFVTSIAGLPEVDGSNKEEA